jgi:hypothetical protein
MRPVIAFFVSFCYLRPFYTPWQGFLTILAAKPCLHLGRLAIIKAAGHVGEFEMAGVRPEVRLR